MPDTSKLHVVMFTDKTTRELHYVSYNKHQRVSKLLTKSQIFMKYNIYETACQNRKILSYLLLTASVSINWFGNQTKLLWVRVKKAQLERPHRKVVYLFIDSC